MSAAILPFPQFSSEDPLEDLVDVKAWEHLGLTGPEFRRRWWQGYYRNDHRAVIATMDRLMRTGRWIPGGPAGGFIR